MIKFIDSFFIRRFESVNIMAQIESFFWGIIAALGALIIELIIFIAFSTSGNPTQNISFSSLFAIPQLIIIAAFIEELFKYLIIVKRVDVMSMGRTSLVNSFFVGAGFLSTELALISQASTLPPTNLLIEISIIHIGTAGLIGYIIATKNPNKISTLLIAIILATILHSSYNLLVLKRIPISNYAIFALLGTILFANFINLIRINSKLAQH